MNRAIRSDSLRNEADWLPSDLDDLAALRRQIIEAGHPGHVANGLIGWLLAKAVGERDATSPTTRSKYRKILAGLEAPGGPRRGRRSRDLAVIHGRPRTLPTSAQNPRSLRSVNLAA